MASPKQRQDPPDVDDGESQDDYIERCVDQLTSDDDTLDESDAEEICQIAWEERGQRNAGPIIHKTSTKQLGLPGMEFVLSDATVDRYGDIIEVNGWSLTNFKKNPIALFNHNPNMVIGTWKNLRVQNAALRGDLSLAPEGTSPRIDEIRRLIDAGILKAVSVGFKPIKDEPIENSFGTRYTEAELVETSVVAVPANPNALAVAKSLNISSSVMNLVFRESAKRNGRTRKEFRAESGTQRQRHTEGGRMSLTERIQQTQSKIAEFKGKLADHWAGIDDTNVSDADIEVSHKLNDEIGKLERKHEQLILSEKALGQTTTGNGPTNGDARRAGSEMIVYNSPTHVSAPTIIKQRKKELSGVDYLARAALVGVYSKYWQKSYDEARQMLGVHRPEFNEDDHRYACDMVLRSASAPAMTQVVGWAAELVQQTWTAPMETLFPNAIFARLAAKGLTLSFGTAGRINIPTRSRTPTIAGSFVGEGAAIPVRQGAFTSQFLVPKKVAVISVWTREMSEHSSPAIEGLIRDAIQQDTSVAIDSILLDANASTAVRPAGILNGVAATTATAGGGFAAVVGDLRALTGALTTNTYGNIRNPAWLMNPTDVNVAKLTVAPNSGIFPWREELNAGTFNGYPVIDSGTVPPKTVILIDAADFVSVGGGAPRMELNDSATLHMEDTTPTDLATGSPATVASPQRSLFQTDSIALRMIMDLNWLIRRTGVVAWTQNVTW